MPSNLESFDEFPMIDVKKMNETEIRLFALLFNLMREPKGISFGKFRKIMPRFYHNEDIDSDRKKLYRDLGQLKSMGFNIKVANLGYQSEDHYPYYLEKESLDQILKFTKDELDYLALILCSESNFENETLLSLSQKLFSKNLDLYPKGIRLHRPTRDDQKNLVGESDLSKIIQALKDKRALVIGYGREKKERIIEPYRLIRKNSEDFYLLAFDRSRKELRRFIIPRIEIKKELREDFISKKKITAEELNFHPLSFKNEKSEIFSIFISPNYIDSFKVYLAGFSYTMKEEAFYLETGNKEALYSFFLKYPEALLPETDKSLLLAFKTFLIQLTEMYNIVS